MQEKTTFDDMFQNNNLDKTHISFLKKQLFKVNSTVDWYLTEIEIQFLFSPM